MAVKEVDIQAYMVDRAVELGAHAFKSQTEWGKGVSDLSVKFIGMPHCYIEVKMGKGGDLTVHQSEFIKSYTNAGGRAGWVRVWPGERRGEYSLLVDAWVTKTAFKSSDMLPGQYYYKAVGKPWPIHEIAHYITGHMI